MHYLVKRLRRAARLSLQRMTIFGVKMGDLVEWQAAEALEAQQQEIERMREALRRIVTLERSRIGALSTLTEVSAIARDALAAKEG